jgi:nucleotidyltransferase substrate binding protein (TIGR01987 family)
MELEKAIAQLELALDYTNTKHIEDEVATQLFRLATIKAFVFTYDLAIRLLRSYLSSTMINPEEVSELSYNQLIRLGYAKNLINAELVVWKLFRENRGEASQAYNVEKAIDVVSHIPKFLEEVKYLYCKLLKHEN